MPATKSLKTLTPAQYAFLRWLYDKHPNVARAAEAHHASLNGFMDSLTSVFNNVVDKAPDLLKQYVAGKSEIETLKVNLARAKAGLYPVDNAGLAQAAAQAASAGGAGPLGVPVLAWVAGGVLVAFLLLRK